MLTLLKHGSVYIVCSFVRENEKNGQRPKGTNHDSNWGKKENTLAVAAVLVAGVRVLRIRENRKTKLTNDQ